MNPGFSLDQTPHDEYIVFFNEKFGLQSSSAAAIFDAVVFQECRVFSPSSWNYFKRLNDLELGLALVEVNDFSFFQ